MMWQKQRKMEQSRKHHIRKEMETKKGQLAAKDGSCARSAALHEVAVSRRRTRTEGEPKASRR